MNVLSAAFQVHGVELVSSLFLCPDTKKPARFTVRYGMLLLDQYTL